MHTLKHELQCKSKHNWFRHYRSIKHLYKLCMVLLLSSLCFVKETFYFLRMKVKDLQTKLQWIDINRNYFFFIKLIYKKTNLDSNQSVSVWNDLYCMKYRNIINWKNAFGRDLNSNIHFRFYILKDLYGI